VTRIIPKGPCKGYIEKYQKKGLGEPPRVSSSIKAHNILQAFKIPFPVGIKEEKENPGWINILFPMHKNFVLTQIPEKWELDPFYEQKKGITHVISFLPKGQNNNNWTEALTVYGYKNFVTTTQQFLETKYSRLKKVCDKETAAALNLKETKDMIVLLTMCGKIEGEQDVGEMSLEKALI
jgi:hypothetical protein